VRRDPARLYFLLFGGIFLLMSVLHLVAFVRQRRDIWWTPNGMRVPIAQAQDRVRVYLAEEPLLDALKAKDLVVARSGGPTPLSESEVSVRFNNWDRVRAEQIPALASYAAGGGAAGVILLFGVLGWTPKRSVPPNNELQRTRPAQATEPRR
jgi:hypothetical protein